MTIMKICTCEFDHFLIMAIWTGMNIVNKKNKKKVQKNFAILQSESLFSDRACKILGGLISLFTVGGEFIGSLVSMESSLNGDDPGTTCWWYGMTFGPVGVVFALL